MKRTLLTLAALAAVMGFASAASALSVTLSADKTTYAIGETITFSVSGDSMAGSDNTILGIALFSGTGGATGTGVGSQTALTTNMGFTTWLVGASTGLGTAGQTIFNQSVIQPAGTVDNLLSGTAQAVATSAGVLNVAWELAGGNTFDFFGLTNAAGLSLNIVAAVPEPGTAALLGLGLIGLALAGRRR